MEVIELTEPYQKEKIPVGDCVLALGFFDGVHRGHQAVIKEAKKQAIKQHQKLAVMTFDRQPKIMYQKNIPSHVQYLTLLKRKLELFAQLGADIAYVVTFNEKMVPMQPQEFVEKYIIGLNATCVVAGADYTYGKKDIANMETLPKFAQGRFKIVSVTHLEDEAQKISSTHIRELIDTGDIFQANKLLGYPFQTQGTVVHGFARGRTIGFPTINIKSSLEQRIPAVGVYATKVWIRKNEYIGMASVGYNDTFGDEFDLTVEINLLNFHADVYGEHVKVEWYERMRGMVKFANAKELILQLQKDEIETKRYFGLK